MEFPLSTHKLVICTPNKMLGGYDVIPRMQKKKKLENRDRKQSVKCIHTSE